MWRALVLTLAIVLVGAAVLSVPGRATSLRVRCRSRSTS